MGGIQTGGGRPLAVWEKTPAIHGLLLPLNRPGAVEGGERCAHHQECLNVSTRQARMRGWICYSENAAAIGQLRFGFNPPSRVRQRHPVAEERLAVRRLPYDSRPA